MLYCGSRFDWRKLCLVGLSLRIAMGKTTKPRFINVTPAALERRRVRTSVRKGRDKKTIGADTRSRTGDRRTAKPCCGLLNCKCQAPPGLQRFKLNELKKNWMQSSLISVEDTTDVEVFKRLVSSAVSIVDVPLAILLGFGFLHALFNQEAVWKAFVDNSVLTYKKPWTVDFNKMEEVLRCFCRANQLTRSSNY